MSIALGMEPAGWLKGIGAIDFAGGIVVHMQQAYLRWQQHLSSAEEKTLHAPFKKAVQFHGKPTWQN